MNASRYTRDGRKSFCAEDTPEEHLQRVGRNLYGYPLQCFKNGWAQESQSYEKSQIKEEKVMGACYDLLGNLPQKVQDEINDVGYDVDSVCDAAETYIMELESKLASNSKEAKTKLRIMNKAHKILEVQNARMLKVLTKFGEIVTASSDLDAELGFEGNQGSERREFDHGCYCGRTVFANDLYKILMDQE